MVMPMDFIRASAKMWHVPWMCQATSLVGHLFEFVHSTGAALRSQKPRGQLGALLHGSRSHVHRGPSWRRSTNYSVTKTYYSSTKDYSITNTYYSWTIKCYSSTNDYSTTKKKCSGTKPYDSSTNNYSITKTGYSKTKRDLNQTKTWTALTQVRVASSKKRGCWLNT